MRISGRLLYIASRHCEPGRLLSRCEMISCNTMLRTIWNIPQRTFCMKSLSRPPILYGDDASPPVRFVKMTASILNVELQYRFVDIFKGGNKTEYYKKINPLQKVPALSLGDSVVCDSHAIAMLLCALSSERSLYPLQPLRRAKVDELLFFNATTLFPVDSFILSAYFADQWPVEKEKIEQWNTALDHLEHKLKNNAWLAGDEMSLCDLCVVATVTSLQTLVPVRHSQLLDWMQRFEELPCFDINRQGIQRLRVFIESKKLMLK